MTETKNSKMLDEGGKSVVALMAALMAAIFAFQLNASMLSPALTTMRVELNTTDAQIGLTQTVFFTSCAVFSLFLPRLGDLIGRKKVLLGILVLTALGCVVSALAVNVPMLMIGRVIQGVAGPIVPMTLIMLHAKVTEDKKYAKLMAILTSVNGGIGGVDAILGGWLAGTFGFRSVFWVMVGVAVLAIVLVFVYAEESTASETPKMDWAGVVSLPPHSWPHIWPSTRFRSWDPPIGRWSLSKSLLQPCCSWCSGMLRSVRRLRWSPRITSSSVVLGVCC